MNELVFFLSYFSSAHTTHHAKPDFPGHSFTLVTAARKHTHTVCSFIENAVPAQPSQSPPRPHPAWPPPVTSGMDAALQQCTHILLHPQALLTASDRNWLEAVEEREEGREGAGHGVPVLPEEKGMATQQCGCINATELTVGSKTGTAAHFMLCVFHHGFGKKQVGLSAMIIR